MVRIVRQQHLVQTLNVTEPLSASHTGNYCVIFAAFLGIKFKRTNNASSGSTALLCLVTADFIACTVYLSVQVIINQNIIPLEMFFVSNALYICVDLISQITMVNVLTYDSTYITDARGLSLFKNKRYIDVGSSGANHGLWLSRSCWYLHS